MSVHATGLLACVSLLALIDLDLFVYIRNYLSLTMQVKRHCAFVCRLDYVVSLTGKQYKWTVVQCGHGDMAMLLLLHCMSILLYAITGLTLIHSFIHCSFTQSLTTLTSYPLAFSHTSLPPQYST